MRDHLGVLNRRKVLLFSDIAYSSFNLAFFSSYGALCY
jgi:hypothetical protein